MRTVKGCGRGAYTIVWREGGSDAEGKSRLEGREGRPIRQEERREGTRGVMPTRERESGPVECVVCMDAPKNCVLMPCFHLCVCMRCGKRLRADSGKCPICRKVIRKARRVYN